MSEGNQLEGGWQKGYSVGHRQPGQKHQWQALGSSNGPLECSKGLDGDGDDGVAAAENEEGGRDRVGYRKACVEGGKHSRRGPY